MIQIIVGLIFLLAGIGLNKGYRNSKLQEQMIGAEKLAAGYKTRQFTLLIISIILIIFSILLLYNAFSGKVF